MDWETENKDNIFIIYISKRLTATQMLKFIDLKQMLKNVSNFSKVSECCLNEQFVSYIMVRTSYIWWDNVCFVLDQHS
jgi:hypothetical protein